MIIHKDMAATAIVAASSASTGRGIGWKGDLPWRLRADLKHFRQVTVGDTTNGDNTQNAVVMGRKTWDSIPPQHRPLKGRTNVVLTRSSGNNNNNFPPEVLQASSLQDAWNQLSLVENLGQIFIMGGAQIYEQAIAQNYVHKIILTEVSKKDSDNDNDSSSMEFDTFFPTLDLDDWKVERTTDLQEEGDYQFQFQTLIKPNKEEAQYLDLIRTILKKGCIRGDRTGTGTQSLFGAQMRFDLRDGTLPLLTTKRVFWRGVAEELLWFIAGATNAKLLQDKGIHIWDGNASKEFLEGRGLGHREEGDLGPVYGFQWRHFGADYQDMHADYTGQGVDQLAECIDKIKNHPEDRRILLSAWNPTALPDMALPPCHLLCQFYVDTTKNEVSCHMYQRSADMGLGVPFNIASYALLTHLIAQVTGRKPGDLVHTLGDAHVYLNHMEPLQEQLARTPRAFPKLYINPDKKEIDDFTYEDLKVVGYQPHKAIAMKMAV